MLGRTFFEIVKPFHIPRNQSSLFPQPSATLTNDGGLRQLQESLHESRKYCTGLTGMTVDSSTPYVFPPIIRSQNHQQTSTSLAEDISLLCWELNTTDGPFFCSC